MSIWQKYSSDEKLVMLQQTAAAKKIIEQAVEKDWWVCVMLNALAKTSWADFLQFKGGTSLSKAWELINNRIILIKYKSVRQTDCLRNGKTITGNYSGVLSMMIQKSRSPN